jgi:two-component system nitrate/nitrite response regulator NarL
MMTKSLTFGYLDASDELPVLDSIWEGGRINEGIIKPDLGCALSNKQRNRALRLNNPYKIRVAILDDHQGILDGYLFRLNHASDIEVVATATTAEEVDFILAHTRPDLLILDVFVPTSHDNPNYYPIFQAIPKWLQNNPQLSVLVISAHNLRTLVKAVVEAGASGYILKDDQTTIQELASVIRTVARGGIYFSKRAHQHLVAGSAEGFELPPRQIQALSLCAAYPDTTMDKLAEMLGVAPSTMRNLLSNAYLRLGVHNRTAAIARARRLGLITPHEPTGDSFIKDDPDSHY